MGIRWMDDRAAVIAAESELLRTRARYRGQSQWLRERLQRHRAGIVVSAGLGAGMLVGRLPLRAWWRTGGAVISSGFAVARTPLGPLLFGALFARRPASAPADGADD